MKQITILMFVLYTFVLWLFLQKHSFETHKKEPALEKKKEVKKRIDSIAESKPINKKQEAYYEHLYKLTKQ